MATRKKSSTETAGHGDVQGRIVKKYPNRRLYDLATSTYITLADVKQMVMQREPLVVVDAKTGENLTRSILLQIILEEEIGGSPIFSETVLAQLIRFYGHAMQGFMGAYIEKTILSMAEMQAQWMEQSRQIPPELWRQWQSWGQPVMPGVVENYTEQSRQAFARAQEQMQENVRQQTAQFWQLFGLKSG